MKNINLETKKQDGFTLQSILIGIVVLGLLAAGTISAVQSNIDAAKTENVKTFFIDGMKNAVTLCYLSSVSFTGCDTTKLKEIAELGDTKTVWGDTWAAVATATKVTITYPLDSFDTDSDVKKAKGAELAIALNKTNAPITVTSDGTDGELTVIYKW